MCELFGVNGAAAQQWNEFLKVFFSHAEEHPHGWGMAFFYGNAVSLEKQPSAANTSDYLRQRLRAPIVTDKMIAHIRLATKGSLDYENTHPFVERDNHNRTWTLAHNGTIFECDTLNPYVHVQKGHTDSERILFYVIRRINDEQSRLGRSLRSNERFAVIDNILCEITPENKVNLLLFDGEVLYVHTNQKATLYRCRKGKAMVFSTRPLDLDRWEPVPMNTLLAYREGKLLYEGTNHGNEFFFSEEKMRLIFLDYSGL